MSEMQYTSSMQPYSIMSAPCNTGFCLAQNWALSYDPSSAIDTEAHHASGFRDGNNYEWISETVSNPYFLPYANVLDTATSNGITSTLTTLHSEYAGYSGNRLPWLIISANPTQGQLVQRINTRTQDGIPLWGWVGVLSNNQLVLPDNSGIQVYPASSTTAICPSVSSFVSRTKLLSGTWKILLYDPGSFACFGKTTNLSGVISFNRADVQNIIANPIQSAVAASAMTGAVQVVDQFGNVVSTPAIQTMGTGLESDGSTAQTDACGHYMMFPGGDTGSATLWPTYVNGFATAWPGFGYQCLATIGKGQYLKFNGIPGFDYLATGLYQACLNCLGFMTPST